MNNLFYNNGTGSNDHGANVESRAARTPAIQAITTSIQHLVEVVAVQERMDRPDTCAVSGNCPGFVNLGGADFRLLSNSPAIDSGTLLSLASLDLLGLLRIAPYLISARHEYWGDVPTNAPAAPTSVRIIR